MVGLVADSIHAKQPLQGSTPDGFMRRASPHQPLAWFFGCYQQVTKAENISNNDLIRKPELKRT